MPAERKTSEIIRDKRRADCPVLQPDILQAFMGGGASMVLETSFPARFLISMSLSTRGHRLYGHDTQNGLFRERPADALSEFPTRLFPHSFA